MRGAVCSPPLSLDSKDAALRSTDLAAARPTNVVALSLWSCNTFFVDPLYGEWLVSCILV